MFVRLKLPSTKRFLKRIIGSRLMSEIIEQEPDWRLHFGMAAARLNLGEASLMKAISDIAGISWEGLQDPLPIEATEPPEASDGDITSRWERHPASHMPHSCQNLKISLPLVSTFLQQGAFPLFTGTGLCGAICIDPSQLPQLLKLKERRLIKLTSYGRLLSYSAPLIEKLRIQQATSPQSGLTSLATPAKELLDVRLRHLFQLITTEAEAFQSTICVITELNNDVIYQFTTPEGEMAEGKISPEIRSPLIDSLSSHASSETRILLSNGKLLSVVKRGKTFHLEINPYRPIKDQPETFEDLSPHHVLVLEDDQLFAKVTALLLQDNGYTQEITHNPFDAIAKLRALKVPPLAIICDLQLANASGLEFIHTVRNDPKLRSLNIIALTSTDDPLPPLKAGADIFIRKSDGPDLLVAYLARLKDRQ